MKPTSSSHSTPVMIPKKILALDGGGIRGALTLGYLQEIEKIIREKEGKPDLLLCDYFDLIGGTSTGSIIASALAIGKTVDEIIDLYMNLGGEVFSNKRKWWNPFTFRKFLRSKFGYTVLEKHLKEHFGGITLGSSDIRTKLCIVAKRADTNSTWPLINHPDGQFFSENKDIPLWQAIRASTAAPTYFIPHVMEVGKGEKAAFIDGGISIANNPAMTLLMVATLKGFPFQWKMGEDKLHLISVGTGYSVFRKPVGKIKKAWLTTWAQNVPDMMMEDSKWYNQIILQWLSNSPTAKTVDMEMGNLENDLLSDTALIKYLRYDYPLTEMALNDLQMRGNLFKEKEVKSLIEMSNAKNKDLLFAIGRAAAKREVERGHF